LFACIQSDAAPAAWAAVRVKLAVAVSPLGPSTSSGNVIAATGVAVAVGAGVGDGEGLGDGVGVEVGFGDGVGVDPEFATIMETALVASQLPLAEYPLIRIVWGPFVVVAEFQAYESGGSDPKANRLSTKNFRIATLGFEEDATMLTTPET
jgi:hypothetical protein